MRQAALQNIFPWASVKAPRMLACRRSCLHGMNQLNVLTDAISASQ